MNALFGKITIIGMGLIGSSIARGVRESGVAQTIVAVDSNELPLVYARKHGFADQTGMQPGHAVEGSDAVIIATPSFWLSDLCDAIAPHLKPGVLVMDTGSVKQMPLVVMTEKLPAHALIVPAHPIAGSEQSGVSAGRADLLEKRRVIITPEAPLTHEQLQLVNRFWQALGARVEAMPAELHDTIYGYVSHLPQLIAFVATPVIAASDAERNAHPMLHRFLRISTSDKTLWSGIFLLNRDVLLAATNRYLDVIVHMRHELAQAPKDIETTASDAAKLVFLPRILASCLITTTMEAEKNAGIGFIRFAGNGFADVASPAGSDPEAELAGMSSHHAQLHALLGEIETRLKRCVAALEADSAPLLVEALK